MTESFNRKLGRLAQNVSGTGTITSNAATASAWQTARTITLGGDLSGSVSIDGSSNVSLTATVSGDTVVLGTDTTGNYVATIAAGSGISVSGSGSETAAVTISVDNTVATLTGEQTLTNKTLTTPVISSITNTGTLTLPTSTDTLVGRATSDTLTNKTISGSNNTISNIGNGSLTNSSITVNGTSIALGASGTLVTDDVAEDASPVNLWFTNTRARSAISATDAGGDGSFSYDSGTGVFTYTGPSATEVRAHLSAGTGLTYTTGQFAIDSTVATLTGSQTLTNKTISGADNTLSNIGNNSLTNSSITINGGSVSLGGTRTLVTDDIAEDGSPVNLWYTDTRSRAAISVTDAGGDGSLSYNSGSGVITYTGPSAAEVRAHFSAGTGVAISSGQISIGQAVATTDNVTFAGVTADNIRVGVTAAGEIDTSSGNLTIDSTGGTTVLDDDVNVTGNLLVDGNLTVSGTTVTVNTTNLAVEDNMIYLNNGSAVTNPDLGFAGNYNDGTYRHAGVFRDASDGVWKFFHQYTPEPDASAYIDITHGSFALAPVQASSFTGSLTGNVTGNASTATTWQTARTLTLSGDVTGTSAAFDGSGNISITTTIAANSVALGTDTTGDYVASVAVAGTGLSVAGSGENATYTITSNATSANTASTIVARDASGNFTAGTITAAISGNATTATTLQTARNINGVSFNGSADITVADSTKLPLAGGTMTGALVQSTAADWYLYSFGTRDASAGAWGIGLTNDIANRTLSFHVPNIAAYSNTGNTPRFGWYSNGAVLLMSLDSDSGNTYIKGTLNAVGAITQNGNQVLHAGNYSSYALPISGGTLTGGRPIELNPTNGLIAFNADAGGWAMGTYFKGSGGTYLAGFGAYGGSDALTYAWIGPAYNSPWLTLNGSAITSTVQSSFTGGGSNANVVLDKNIASPANYYNGLQLEVRATSGTAGISLHRNGYSHVGIYHNTANVLQFELNAGTVTLNHDAGTLIGSGNYSSYPIMRYPGGVFTGNFQDLTDSPGELRIDQVNNINAGGYSNQPPNVYTYGGVLSWRTANHSFQLYASHTGDLTFKTQWQNDNYSGWQRILHESNYTSFVNYGNPSTRGTYQITNWNQTTYPNVHFLSSENGVSNAPTSDFTYGLQYAFHRDGASYRTQMVTALYSNLSIYVRNSRDSDTWTSWKELLHSGNYSSYALPLSGGAITGNVTFGSLLKIGTDNSDWATGNYFRGSTNHLVIGVQAGGTLYLNYGNTTGPLRMEGNSLLWNGASTGFPISITGTAGSISGFNNPTTAATANTIAYRTSLGDIAVRELILEVGVQSFTPSSMVAIYPTTNQAVKVDAAGARNFLDVPTRSGGNASGTWGINITGNAATLGSYASSSFGGPTSLVKQFYIGTLYANGAQARTHEIARLGIDYNDWNGGIGMFEVELWETYYSRGVKKRYAITWGYSNNYQINLVEFTGNGDNQFQARIGSPVQVSGDLYYLPVFVDVRYYSQCVVRVNTSRNTQTSSSTPAIDNTYINLSPTAVDISDFTPDSTVNMSIVSTVQVAGNQLLHAGNYNSYSPTLTGTGASGTWSINITGNAATLGNLALGTSTSTVAYWNSSRNLVVYNPEAYSGEVRVGAAWDRGGIYGSNGVSVATGNGLFIDHVHNNITTARHVYDANGSRFILGTNQTTTPYTLVDTNARPTMYLRGQYPVLVLDHTVTSNTLHGPTIQFVHDGLGARQWLIGSSGDGLKFDMGFSSSDYSNTNYNPHNGIGGYLGVTFMTVRTNGRMGFGWGGDWGSSGNISEPLHPFHFHSTRHQNTHSYLFRNDNNGSAGDGNGAGAIFVNTRGDHSWGVVAEFRVDQGAGYDKPSILFSQGNNNNTFTVGFGYNDADYFRINRDHGHRNSSWGTTLMLLDRSGNVTFTGNVTAYSDQRLKKNVTKIENALALVQQLEGVTFDYIEDNRPGLGMIAQEVEKILPVLVGEAPATNGITYKNIAYGNVVAVLIEAIKEQQKQIDELKNSRGIQS